MTKDVAAVICLQDRFQEDPVHMAMIICRNLKEEQKILAIAKSVEVKTSEAFCHFFAWSWVLLSFDSFPGLQRSEVADDRSG